MSTLEIIGFLFGVGGVWLTIKESPFCFPVGLVNVIASSFLFFYQKLYADVLQQIMYVVLLCYGWYAWTTEKSLSQKSTVNSQQHEDVSLKSQTFYITTSSPRLLFNCIFVIASSTYVLGTILKWYTAASVPYWDALATCMSFTAQYLVARKKIENWMIWMDVNVLYVGIYLYKGLYLYTILFAIYFVLAVIGYLKWKKELNPVVKND